MQQVSDFFVTELEGINRSASHTPTGLSGQANAVYSWFAVFVAFLIPWSDMVLLPYDVQVSRPLVALAICSWLYSLVNGNVLRRVGFPVSVMMIFVLLVPAHLLVAEDPGRIGRRVLSYLGLFLMVLFFQQTIRSWVTYRRILSAVIAGCGVTLCGLAWNLVTGVLYGDGRYSAPGFDPNDLAAQLALSIPVASYLAFNLASGALWFRLYLPFAVVGALLTASRAGLVVLLLASAYPALCLLRRTQRGRLGILIAIFCTVSAVYYAAPQISFQRLGTMGQELIHGDMNGRGTVWINGFHLFWDNPIFGIGAGGFSAAVTGNLRMVAHNTFLEVLVEHGVLGLLVFLSIVFGLLWRTQTLPADEQLLWRVVIGSWVVVAMTLSWENREYTWLIWALCGSCVTRNGRSRALRLDSLVCAIK